jgi:tetratricopeptide (TPR) repeat protein
MAVRTFVSRFSPNRTDPAVLEAIFVQRHKLAEVWFERLRDSVLTGVKHHLLAVGPRGCGKSHLVALLVSRLRKDPAVAERVRIAWLPEDETTSSFWKLLLRILRALNAEYGDEFPTPPRDRLEDATDDRRAAVLTEFLLQKLGKHTLLVVVENLDDVMRGLKDEGQKRWRAFLQEHPVAATLATSQQLTEDVSDRDRPFFNFFQIEHLLPLTADDALSLLQRIAEHTGNTDLASFLQTAMGRARVRAIRHIAGGSHRVFIILSEFATREGLDNLVTAFEELLDELTPYYQDRLRWLPDQQREIIEFLCRQARTVPVKEIAKDLFLSEQAAAAQLKSLKDKGYVIAGSVGRESRYELAEPLMRLCVEVKDPQREPIRLIVEFLRIWYDRPVLETRLECLSAEADLERGYLEAALEPQRPETLSPVEAVQRQDLQEAWDAEDWEGVARIAVETANTAKSPESCLCAAMYLLNFEQYADEAAAACDRAIQIDPSYANAFVGKGSALTRLDRPEEALAAYDRAIDLDLKNVVAWANKGFILNALGRHPEALAMIDRVIELDPTNAAPWNNKGYALQALGLHAGALAAFDRATKLDPTYCTAWNNIGHSLHHLGRFSEALVAFDRATELDSEHASAWHNKGNTLNRIGRHMEALAAFDRAIHLIPDYEFAWNNKGTALEELGRFEEALVAYNRAIELNPRNAIAWNNKGHALNKLGQFGEALCALDRAVELGLERAYHWENRGWAKLGLGEIGSAINDFHGAIKLDRDHAGAFEGLAVAHALQGDWAKAEMVLLRRFRLAPWRLQPARSSHLSDLIAAIFQASSRREELAYRADRVANIACESREEWRLGWERGKANPNPSITLQFEGPAPNPLAMLGDSLVRSLTKKAYTAATAAALDDWAGVWREVTTRHPDLSLATRLFSVGVRYVQTTDERVLLDLVQEERSILRDLFGLDDGTDGA